MVKLLKGIRDKYDFPVNSSKMIIFSPGGALHRLGRGSLQRQFVRPDVNNNEFWMDFKQRQGLFECLPVKDLYYLYVVGFFLSTFQNIRRYLQFLSIILKNRGFLKKIKKNRLK